MDGTQNYDISKLSDEQLVEMQEDLEDADEDKMEDQVELSQDMQELYGAPTESQQHNQHTFIHKAAFDSRDTIRTTYLSKDELGRPLFSVRFLLDLHKIASYYLDPILAELKLDPKKYNGIANYFWQKNQNITNSGMSNEGFSMNLNVTQKKDMVRRRIRTIQQSNLKGGKQTR